MRKKVKRKSPIRHKVRVHLRRGKRVESFVRGEGSPNTGLQSNKKVVVTEKRSKEKMKVVIFRNRDGPKSKEAGRTLNVTYIYPAAETTRWDIRRLYKVLYKSVAPHLIDLTKKGIAVWGHPGGMTESIVDEKLEELTVRARPEYEEA